MGPDGIFILVCSAKKEAEQMETWKVRTHAILII